MPDLEGVNEGVLDLDAVAVFDGVLLTEGVPDFVGVIVADGVTVDDGVCDKEVPDEGVRVPV